MNAIMKRVTRRNGDHDAAPRWLAKGAEVCALVLLGGPVGLLVFLALAPSVLGWHFVMVSGGSMEPAIGFGSLAVVEEIRPGDISPGDIVTFRHPSYGGKVVTHRV